MLHHLNDKFVWLWWQILNLSYLNVAIATVLFHALHHLAHIDVLLAHHVRGAGCPDIWGIISPRHRSPKPLAQGSFARNSLLLGELRRAKPDRSSRILVLCPPKHEGGPFLFTGNLTDKQYTVTPKSVAYSLHYAHLLTPFLVAENIVQLLRLA